MERKKEKRRKRPYTFMLVAASLDGKIAPRRRPELYGLWESNINVTTDDDPEKCDPLSGGWPFKGQYLRCRISKATPGNEKS
jgi:hypothetical protein